MKIYQQSGCQACDNTGYRGRTSITELFKVNSEIDELIGRRAGAREILKLARELGFKTLADDAARRVIDGTTSMDEISRVVDLTERLMS